MSNGSSKKRKEVVQATTLFDYFGASTKKTRFNQADSTQERPEHITKSTRRAEDVIVISSDGDEDVSVIEDPAEYGHNITPFTVAEDCSVASTSRVGTLCVQSNTTLEDDEWAMGDDEGILEDDEDTTGGEDECPSNNSGSEVPPGVHANNHSCPVCGKSLSGMFTSEIERHVNECLDSDQLPLPDTPNQPSVQPEKKEDCRDNSKFSGVLSDISVPQVNTAFSVLMSSHKESIAWKEAAKAENMKGGVKGRRLAPFYKVLQGMPIAVDAFRYGKIPGVTAYFLTHAHADHYTNLSSTWKNGPIYCSETTANLVIHMLNVDPKWVHSLPMNTVTVISDTGGVKVTLIQANHCPGSVLFYLEGLQTVNAGDSTYKSPFVGSSRIFRYLHCGDFRACPEHALHSEINGKQIDTVYLDTTYLDPKYCFPPQPLVVSACAELARRIVEDGYPSPNSIESEGGNPSKSSLESWVTVTDKGKGKVQPQESGPGKHRTLVVVGTYTIGKERIVKAIAQKLSTKVYCDPRKTAVMKCLADPELHALLTQDPFAAGVHVVPLHMISSDHFDDYLTRWGGRWTRAVGFRPTGWTYTSSDKSETVLNIPHIISRDQARNFTYTHLKPMRNSNARTMLYGVPYSEHSSFFELTCFALSLNWTRIIATVNVGNARSRGKMEKWFEKWQAERTRRIKAGEENIVQYRALNHW